MRVIVYSDKGGQIQSVTVPNPKFPDLHVEMEGAQTHDIEVTDGLLREDELMGKKGLEVQQRAYETLRGVLEKSRRRT